MHDSAHAAASVLSTAGSPPPPAPCLFPAPAAAAADPTRSSQRFCCAYALSSLPHTTPTHAAPRLARRSQQDIDPDLLNPEQNMKKQGELVRELAQP